MERRMGTVPLLTKCKKCNGYMAVERGVYHCVYCGWVDYSKKAEDTKRPTGSKEALLTHPAFYAGDEPRKGKSPITVNILELNELNRRERFEYSCECPFCDEFMDAAHRYTSQKGNNKGSLMMRCFNNHQIYLFTEHEPIIWK